MSPELHDGERCDETHVLGIDYQKVVLYPFYTYVITSRNEAPIIIIYDLDIM